jgi:His-Xaa-Ser system protein HxsD
VYFSPSNENTDLRKIIGEFSNRLIWQEVRQKIADETKTIREIIVAQALTEGNVLNHSGIEADYNNDPNGIAQ